MPQRQGVSYLPEMREPLEYTVTELAQLCVGDERFRVYYEATAPGCAKLFRDALNLYSTVHKIAGWENPNPR